MLWAQGSRGGESGRCALFLKPPLSETLRASQSSQRQAEALHNARMSFKCWLSEHVSSDSNWAKLQVRDTPASSTVPMSRLRLEAPGARANEIFLRLLKPITIVRIRWSISARLLTVYEWRVHGGRAAATRVLALVAVDGRRHCSP